MYWRAPQKLAVSQLNLPHGTKNGTRSAQRLLAKRSHRMNFVGQFRIFNIFAHLASKRLFTPTNSFFGGWLLNRQQLSTPTQQAYPSTKARRTDHQIGPPIFAQLTAENGSPLFPFTFASLHRGSGRPSNTVSWCGKINQHLAVHFLSNTSAQIIKIRQYFLKLQLKMSGILFTGHTVG